MNASLLLLLLGAPGALVPARTPAPPLDARGAAGRSVEVLH